MRPGLQKMLSHCGMAENSSLRTTLVHSNQQGSGPLYKGVRQSVSKKAEPPTETGPANKWASSKEREREKKKASFHICNILYHNVFIFLFHLHVYRAIPWRVSSWNTMGGGKEYLHALMAFRFLTMMYLQVSCHMPVWPSGWWVPWKRHHVLFILLSNFQHSACSRSHSIRIWWKSCSIPLLLVSYMRDSG